MCTQSCIEFVTAHLSGLEVRGRTVLEVGALDVNGSMRSYVLSLEPARYLGVDMQAGPGVDEVCPAEQLIARFGENAFDIVVSTEMLEHVFDWRLVLRNLKRVLKPGGLLLVTTRSIGFGYHAYPYDFWRYQREDMQALFADFEILTLADDALSPGIFVKAKKPDQFREVDLGGHALHSMITRCRSVAVDQSEIARFHFRRRILQRLHKLEKWVRHMRDLIER